VDFYSDYIGGEVRLAYYCDGGKTVPVTGVSVSGKLSEVLESIRFSRETGIYNGYCGPCKAILQNMNIF
jgi:predicted Zn-dependent protease